MYRNSTPVTKEPKLPEQVIDIVKLNTNSTPEVHPVSTLQPNCVENEGGNGQNARKETEHAEESMGGSNRVWLVKGMWTSTDRPTDREYE